MIEVTTDSAFWSRVKLEPEKVVQELLGLMAKQAKEIHELTKLKDKTKA
jgi:hypothetical protein